MSMRFSFAVINENKAWVVPGELSGVVEVDLDSCESKIITALTEHSVLDRATYGAVYRKEEYIVIAPMCGVNFYLYNIKTKKIKKLISLVKKVAFFASFSLDTDIYFVGWDCPLIAKIDIRTETVKIINVDIFNENNVTKGVFGRSVSLKNDKAYIPLTCSNKFLIFDLQTELYKLQEFGNISCIATCCDGDNLCLIPKSNGNVEIYDLKKQRLQSSIILPEGLNGKEEERWYSTALYHCGYGWVFPYKSNMILRVDMKSGQIVCVKKFEVCENIKYLNAGIYDESHIWGFYHEENRLDIIDCFTNKIQSKSIQMPSNLCSFIDENSIMNNVISEHCLHLEDYLCIVEDKKLERKKNDNILIGINIWNKLSKEMFA